MDKNHLKKDHAIIKRNKLVGHALERRLILLFGHFLFTTLAEDYYIDYKRKSLTQVLAVLLYFPSCSRSRSGIFVILCVHVNVYMRAFVCLFELAAVPSCQLDLIYIPAMFSSSSQSEADLVPTLQKQRGPPQAVSTFCHLNTLTYI